MHSMCALSLLLCTLDWLCNDVCGCARLSNGGSIQMLTALVLQLVQCLVSPRDNSDGTELKVQLSCTM